MLCFRGDGGRDEIRKEGKEGKKGMEMRRRLALPFTGPGVGREGHIGLLLLKGRLRGICPSNSA